MPKPEIAKPEPRIFLDDDQIAWIVDAENLDHTNGYMAAIITDVLWLLAMKKGTHSSCDWPLYYRKASALVDSWNSWVDYSESHPSDFSLPPLSLTRLLREVAILWWFVNQPRTNKIPPTLLQQFLKKWSNEIMNVWHILYELYYDYTPPFFSSSFPPPPSWTS